MVRIVGLSLLCGLTFSAGGSAAGAPNLNEVKKFDAYSVYYAGQAVGRSHLDQIEKRDWQGKGRRIDWIFHYADCTQPGRWGGCSFPLQIQIYSTCRRWADAYPGRPRLFNFRGAKAAWVPTAGSLEIYTGRTTVVIFGDDRRIARRAARLTRNVRRVRPTRLPPPVRGSLYGKLPCQRKPL